MIKYYQEIYYGFEKYQNLSQISQHIISSIDC